VPALAYILPGAQLQYSANQFRGSRIIQVSSGVYNPGSGIFLIRDSAWKKFGSGSWDKHPGSATLYRTVFKEKSIRRKNACFCVHKIKLLGLWALIYEEEETALDPCSFYEDRVPGFFLNVDPQPDFF
jgi:hypothetical protein